MCNCICNICRMENPYTQWANQTRPISNEHIGSVICGFSYYVLCCIHAAWKKRLFSSSPCEDTERRTGKNWEMCHIHVSCLSHCEQEDWLSRPRLLAFGPVCWHAVAANLTVEKGTGRKKNGKHARSASVLLPVAERLDSQCCWQQFKSEPAPPCRLCAGSPVCCVGALPPGHTSARGILHTIALLFGYHPSTICIWPHSHSVWATTFWRLFCLFVCFFTCSGCMVIL